MPSLHTRVTRHRIPSITRITRITRPVTIGAVAVAILLACHSIAAAQSPSYTTRPRSNGGRAAGFGTATPGRGTSRPATGGAAAPRAGAPRPSIGSTAPSAPLKGGSSTRSSTPRASGGGMQVLSADQLKAGQGQPMGGVRGRR